MAIKSLPGLVTFFLGIPCRLISFLTAHKVLLAGSSIGVCFCIGVATGVMGRTWLVRVLLVVAAVCKVDV
jgi:hypothetical protein